MCDQAWSRSRRFAAAQLPGWSGCREVSLGGWLHHVRSAAHGTGLPVVTVHNSEFSSFSEVSHHLHLIEKILQQQQQNLLQRRHSQLPAQRAARRRSAGSIVAGNVTLVGRPVPSGSGHLGVLQGRTSLRPAVLL